MKPSFNLKNASTHLSLIMMTLNKKLLNSNHEKKAKSMEKNKDQIKMILCIFIKKIYLMIIKDKNRWINFRIIQILL